MFEIRLRGGVVAGAMYDEVVSKHSAPATGSLVLTWHIQTPNVCLDMYNASKDDHAQATCVVVTAQSAAA